MDMCRFNGPRDVEYRKVADVLRQMTVSFPETRVPNTSPFLTKERRQELQDSLGFDQIDARRATIKRTHIKTCEWLKTKDEYLDWLDPSKITEHHGFLRIKGNPGTGKSTLMKFAFDDAWKTMNDKIVLSFFFNARGEELEQSTAGMYRSLLLQLLQRITGLETIFDSLHLTSWPQGRQIQWSVESLKDLFEQAVQSLGRSWVICFIDALDECDEDQIRDMVTFFEHIGAQAIASNIRFQVCFSSRHYPYITIARGLELVLEGQGVHDQDIASYVKSELKIGHSRVAQEIRTELRTKAAGVFMWVVLVVAILNKEYDRGRIHALRNRLREIPDRLHDLFRDILTRNTRNRDMLILCIQWVLFANRPLRPEELYFAVLAGMDHEPLAPWDKELITLAVIERFIIDSSKGLAETTKSEIPTVQFIHESVRDFLTDNGLRNIWPDLGDRFQGQSHEQLKQCCLRYNCTEIAETLHLREQLPKTLSVGFRSPTLESFPFLDYAVHGVLYHTDEAESGGIAQSGFLQSFCLQKWIHLHDLLGRYKICHHTLNATFLHQAAEDGYLAIAKLLVEAGADKEAKSNDGLTPLSLAVRNGPFEVIKLLIGAGANEEARCNDGLTPLSWAALEGHFETVRVLVEAGANKEAKDNAGQTPLYLAALGGHHEAVEVLIEAGANKEAKDNGGQTLLCWAARQCKVEVIELLLEAGGNKEAEENVLTPLYWAVRKGHLEVVELLVEAGANKAAKDNDGRTPLYWAVYFHHEEIEKLLSTQALNEME